MPERPLLRLPNPNVAEVPGGPRPVPNLRKPTKGRQRDRFAPVFDRLQTVLSRPGDPIELQEDPTALAPERVIVFEIGGTVQNFLKALAKVDGLEFMAELEIELYWSRTFERVSSKDRACVRSAYMGHGKRNCCDPWFDMRTVYPAKVMAYATFVSRRGGGVFSQCTAAS